MAVCVDVAGAPFSLFDSAPPVALQRQQPRREQPDDLPITGAVQSRASKSLTLYVHPFVSVAVS